MRVEEVAWLHQGGLGRSGKQEVAGARGHAHGAHARRPSVARKTTGGRPVGWAAQCWTSTGAGPVGGRQVSPGEFFPLYYL